MCPVLASRNVAIWGEVIVEGNCIRDIRSGQRRSSIIVFPLLLEKIPECVGLYVPEQARIFMPVSPAVVLVDVVGLPSQRAVILDKLAHHCPQLGGQSRTVRRSGKSPRVVQVLAQGPSSSPAVLPDVFKTSIDGNTFSNVLEDEIDLRSGH